MTTLTMKCEGKNTASIGVFIFTQAFSQPFKMGGQKQYLSFCTFVPMLLWRS